ncbi:MAG: outer membrane protein assembly factor BamA [Chlorobium sp.]|uniref:outer membrane protein assembly factor BamA n=1 Tax=Chlorobium sp. TaxID=1095 RepID=UPI0025B7BFDF|nr:outer membrane protein assembly factor BamA [Chlorobium sp.]MCF8215350.1 outer membrane protein assembly factor BamA [Chlorobium sp.]MCF8270188.1 outer membrane protein assembly factor BamA [Chlorobium sp.]MCF8286557.1 outer membrane protein assembly factor BamA [Chlorobium sp.]MCF8290156.1 outer membrane protein assembly factor BamA [Chlorobium sp.]MCF8384315.1 outer membrane protein assembly factor BamA [Chlorobium sp.]
MKKMRKLIALVLVALALDAVGTPVEAATQAPVKEGPSAPQRNSAADRQTLYTVTGITFSGLESLKAEELAARLPVKLNEKITIPGPELSGAMQYLWQLQLFSDIGVEKTEHADKNVTLKFIVRELPLLESMSFEGNDKFDAEELQRTAEIRTGKKLNEQELLTAVNKIEKLYAGKGYLTAGAEYRLQETGANKVKAIISIREGSKVAIEKIRFHGNNAFSQGKLRGVFKETAQNSWWRKIFGAPKLDKDKFTEDKNLLIEFYRENGYRDAKVVSDSISYTDNKKGLFLDIHIEEGPLYSIGNVTFIGNTREFATTEILEKTFRIKSGDSYNAKLIQERLNFSQDNSDVSSLYLDRGYLGFRANLEEQVTEPGKVDLLIYLREGEQFQLKTINIKGNTKTKDHVIRRELYTIPGDMFSRKNVVRSIREINMLSYFDPESLKPDIQPDERNNTVDITYAVTEKQTDTFNASIGYSGSSGFIGALGVTFNNFSLQDIFNTESYRPLPHGDGQKLSLQWQFGNDDYNTLGLSFTEPWAFGGPTAIGFSVFKTHRTYDFTDDDNDENEKTIDQYGTTLNIGRRLTWPDDYFSINWKIKYLHSEGGFVSFIQDEGDAPEEADEFSITQTISRNSIDSPIYPRRGSKNSLSAQLAGGPLPGTINFYKFTLNSSWYLPVTKNLIFNFSTQHGYLSTFDKEDYLPYTDYFYMGGSGLSSLPTIPMRGYDDRSFGTQLDDDSELYGGTIYSKFSTELRYPLTLSPSVSVYALAFFEAGNLWENMDAVNYSDMKKAAGLGLRLYLPIIGLVGLDYGYGFDKVPGDDEKGWKFMFTFGTSAE